MSDSLPPPPPGLPPPPPPPGGYPAESSVYASGYPGASGWRYGSDRHYGGFWIRLAAILLDSIILGIPIWILIGVFGINPNAAFKANFDPTGAAALVSTLGGVTGVLTIVYFVFFWSLGSTLGMRVFRLRVGDADTGEAIGLPRALLRYLGYVLSVLVCYIGLIWAGFDSRKQGWHDKIAGSVVLRD